MRVGARLGDAVLCGRTLWPSLWPRCGLAVAFEHRSLCQWSAYGEDERVMQPHEQPRAAWCWHVVPPCRTPQVIPGGCNAEAGGGSGRGDNG